jgi:hypothetical protein
VRFAFVSLALFRLLLRLGSLVMYVPPLPCPFKQGWENYVFILATYKTTFPYALCPVV